MIIAKREFAESELEDISYFALIDVCKICRNEKYIELRLLRYFLTVAKEQNFTKAREFGTLFHN